MVQEWYNFAMYNPTSECNSVGPWKSTIGVWRIPILFVIVRLLVIVQAINAKKTCRDKTYVCFTFNYLDSKKFLLHFEILYSALILAFRN